ncbi:MAG: DUF4254 domain-containing protein [Eudoraea sp.]|nr:DUF4254 domain-containing protein [Eudoraea sp.]
MFTALALPIFRETIATYHIGDNVDQPITNPYPQDEIAHLLFNKCWIDTVQWHLEDIIRDPGIDPAKALEIKRRIDKSNQDRTNLVEIIDDFFLSQFKEVDIRGNATINTESPAWAIDRLSILALKIYHMREEVERTDADAGHKSSCQAKLNVLEQQENDLSLAIDQLLQDIAEGKKYMKVYKQMKMYNDDELNPVLRGQK